MAREARFQLATGLGPILWKMLMYNFVGKVIEGALLKKRKTSLTDLKGGPNLFFNLVFLKYV